MLQREIGAGRCEAAGAARGNLAGRERTTAPRGTEDTHPGRICLVRNVKTPSRSRRRLVAWWADREES
jgi:hypothetical protein